jgi:rSAM/selenodomain-associated transferase 2
VRVSIIIPTLNEASCLPETLRSVREQRPHEIIIADGGSTDATYDLAAAADVVLRGPRGRAPQMNLGAAHATGDILLFLHADCILEPGGVDAASRCLRRPDVAAACFRMRVLADGWAFRSIDFFATARVRLTGIIYGDQGIAVRRERFERVGGFPNLRLMEDVFFSLKLRRTGQMVVAPRHIYVSARRWHRQGVVRQTLRNWKLTALAAAGVHPDRLAAYYPAIR